MNLDFYLNFPWEDYRANIPIIEDGETTAFLQVTERGFLGLHFYGTPIIEIDEKDDVLFSEIDELGKKYNLSLRAYETKRGYRFIESCRRFDFDYAYAIQKAFPNDPNYVTQTGERRYFTARITCKPLRLDMKSMNHLYPLTSDKEQAYLTWQQEYNQKRQGYGVCRYLKTIGVQMSTELSLLLQVHDAWTEALVPGLELR